MCKESKNAKDKSETIAELPMACADETHAVEFWEKHRWGDCPGCPHCGDTEVYQMKDRKTGERNKRFLWRCRGCNKQFTVRVGTALEESRIPLKHWAYALWRACTSKKGVSALEIKRQTGLSYKSALFLMHRIRWILAPANAKDMKENGKLNGTVEADETHVGGKPRHRRPHKANGKYEWKHKPKQPVFGALERGGKVRTRVIPDVTSATLEQACNQLIDKAANLNTDEGMPYRRIGKQYASHESVKHSSGEYVRGDVTTNTIESFWAILKRGINGIYHNVSRKHLQRYLDEFEYRYNTREMEDGDRVIEAIHNMEGKRLAKGYRVL